MDITVFLKSFDSEFPLLRPVARVGAPGASAPHHRTKRSTFGLRKDKYSTLVPHPGLTPYSV
jgi:hypothetical protein